MEENLKLDVFISWSGECSGAIASKLKTWLEVAFPFTRPFLSMDIGAGKRWSEQLANALEVSNFGILILTPDNLNSDWILFEAGALAKHLDYSRVIPLLIDMNASQLNKPLSDFMALRLKDELLKLAMALNDALPDPYDSREIQESFDWTQERFHSDVKKILEENAKKGPIKKNTRPPEEVLDDILQIVKSLRTPRQVEDMSPQGNEQYYPVNDRISLYKFLKKRVSLPLYKNASMPALFEAAANFLQDLNSDLDNEEALSYVAKHLVSERPLHDLLEGLRLKEDLRKQGAIQ